MNKLIYLLLVSIFFLDYLAITLGVISKYIAWLPEILTMIMAVIVMAMASQGRMAISRAFSVILAVYLLDMFIGIVLNGVHEGVLIAGMRSYLKFLPIVLLPMVYSFDEKDVKKILIFILALCVMQAPLSLYQRLFQFKNVITGDVVTGTTSSSGLLSVILYCAVAVVVSFYVKNRIKLSAMLILCLLLVIPTTINGTKSSLIFLPIATIAPLVMSSQKGKLRKLIPVAIVLSILAIILITVADSVYDRKNLDAGVMDFFSREGRLESYLYRGVQAGDRFQHMGKIDSYMIALSVLSENPWKLAFGLGIGNVAGSSISSLSGAYSAEYSRYGPGVTSIAQLIWEVGVFGVVLYLLLLYSIYKASLSLSHREGLSGAIGHGWSVVTIIIFLGLFYKNILQENIIVYTYWFISGYVIATNIRSLRRPKKQSTSSDSVEPSALLSKRVTLKK